VELILYGEPSRGCDGDRGWVSIPNADTGMDAQDARWGWLVPSALTVTMPGQAIGVWSGVHQVVLAV